MSKLGGAGSQCAHLERDLMKWAHVCEATGASLYFLKCDLIGSEGVAVEHVIPVLPIHEMAHAIWTTGEDQFLISLLGTGGEEGVLQWWQEACKNCEWAREHPAIADRSRMGHTLPLMTHADGVEVFRNSEYEARLWGSLLARGSVWESKFVFCILAHSLMSTPVVANAVEDLLARFFAWCIDVWNTGVFPHVGFHNEPIDPKSPRGLLCGKPICGGKWTAALCAWKGDWKARVKVHQFLRYYRGLRLCDCDDAVQCFASADPRMTYSDFREDAPWRATIMNNDEYIAQARLTNTLSPWFQVQGFRKERG